MRYKRDHNGPGSIGIRPHLEHFQKLGSIKRDALMESGRRSLEREAFVDGV